MPRPHRFGLFGVALAGLALLGAPALAQPPAKPDAAQVAPAAAPDTGVRTLHTGTLQAGDTQLESGEYYDEYILDGAGGDEIIAVLSSLDFDPYLILILPSGEQLDNDDFSGSRDVSLLEIPVETAGRHALRVTSYAREETGEYALMTGTRMADGNDAGHDDFDVEPETFDVKGPIEIGRQISGTLGEDDPVRTDGSHYEGYSFQGQEGANLVITLTSADFDAYLTLVRPSGTTQENDDGTEGDTSSRIELTLDESGEWIVVANTLIAGETGDYRLTISRR
jgi:serine protease Do